MVLKWILWVKANVGFRKEQTMRDHEEFTRLARAYMDTVYRVAYGCLRSPPDAEDVTQNVLLKLYRWVLPEGVGPETRYLDADTLEQWKQGIAGKNGIGSGITVTFYRSGQREPEYAYISYAATGSGPYIIFGSDYAKG